jgi:hypothetical protein
MINEHSPALHSELLMFVQRGLLIAIERAESALAVYTRRTTGPAAGNGLGTTLNYLRGATGNGRAQRSSTFGARRALPRATAWAPR